MKCVFCNSKLSEEISEYAQPCLEYRGKVVCTECMKDILEKRDVYIFSSQTLIR
jgi:hypothetical protein